MSEEFKLNIYFNMYKDYPIASRDFFREMFVKKHGGYNYLPELIHMIEKYQFEKYGTNIWYCKKMYHTSKKKKGRR